MGSDARHRSCRRADNRRHGCCWSSRSIGTMVEDGNVDLLCDGAGVVRESTANTSLLAFPPSLDLCAQRHVPPVCHIPDREPVLLTVVLGHTSVAGGRHDALDHRHVSVREKLWGDRGESGHQTRRPVCRRAAPSVPGRDNLVFFDRAPKYLLV